MEMNRNPYEDLRALDDEIMCVATELNELERLHRSLKERRQRLLVAIRTLEDQGFITNPTRLAVSTSCDPELERLLAEEEEIERQIRNQSEGV